MSEFEEYWKSVTPRFQNRLPIEKGTARNAWNFQQQKIDELKTSLKEIIGTMKSNHAYHGDDNSWKCNDEDCIGCMYERRYLKDKENE